MSKVFVVTLTKETYYLNDERPVEETEIVGVFLSKESAENYILQQTKLKIVENGREYNIPKFYASDFTIKEFVATE